MIDELAAILVESDRLRIPLDLEPLQIGTIDGELLNDLIDVNARGYLLEPAEWRTHDGNSLLNKNKLCVFAFACGR